MRSRTLRGGTGETFDWALLPAGARKTPLILSGGLHPGNVAQALERVRPYAVDTASGTERAPGHKDEAKLRAFFDAVASSIGRPACNAEPAAGSETRWTAPGASIEGAPA